ncbi:nitronate monooxygenase [Marinithermofilum abyssi]|uniref:Probable nitronate monooxygenase n=1 Tax=Marinithermofilum abyssi TaxID=1571185 RepID=A0A8J2Y930_9BACL|nr:nitronate monooxygenase [Marinithermofilum abyssi]GGE13758.1 nitronate monooxygenase [Marinithermofilum abyssi]
MSWKQTKLTEMLSIATPIIQAGMAGGSTTPDLVAAVSNAGGLGTLGAAYLSPEAMREAIRKIREKTTRPFAVNLQIPPPYEESPQVTRRMRKHLQSYEKKLGVPREEKSPPSISFSDQMRVVLEEKVPVFSFTFGIPEPELIKQLRDNQTVTIGTATTVNEAVELEKRGVDAVAAQGFEAGGHRGTFQSVADYPYIGSMALIPQVVDHVSIPVIASGGIMDGRGILASLALGAAGVQMGSAFLTTLESGAHPLYKEALLQTTDESTVITKAFSGRPARGIRNAFIQEMERHPEPIPPFPIQNALTKPLRKFAAKQNNLEYMSLWGGQASALGRLEPAGELMERLQQEVEDLVSRF